ncbi:GNAT family N-acetyltransferase [Lacibacter luteus]|uniref:GNAT family N-acetyltransferase n=1 Tax=Lacibacter luteus TaxID=2508719 RepID=A0A4Q1CKB4_9BACT|nr:GNAT family N-acetyltransferase [Lacibacter luteus]RXK60782.1 GNAT family N-acetyltransferase [Lacibacter luteus]
MLTFNKTDSDNSDFRLLVAELDRDLAARYGEQQLFFNQFNKLDHIHHVIVAYYNQTPVGCGAFKLFEDAVVEIKRMYVEPQQRGKGIAALILQQLEQWAKAEGFTACVLETGLNQPEAIRLYEKAGYERTPNYGQYIGVEISICMRKELQ